MLCMYLWMVIVAMYFCTINHGFFEIKKINIFFFNFFKGCLQIACDLY